LNWIHHYEATIAARLWRRGDRDITNSHECAMDSAAARAAVSCGSALDATTTAH
jgi:hypothetical protein